MSLLGKLQPIIILFSAIIGVILGIFTTLGKVSTNLIEIFLMLLLYVLFVSINSTNLKKSAANLKYLLCSLCINFIVTPVLAYVLGVVFFGNNIEIRIGLLMLLVTPCTDWYLVFTKLSHGNVEINMSILPINLLLQVALLPVYLFVFLGNSVHIDVYTVFESIIAVLLIPCICAIITRVFVFEKYNIQKYIVDNGDILQLIFLCFAVVIMFASEGQNLLENYVLLIKMFIPLLCFFSITFFIVKILGEILTFDNKEISSLHMTTLARNSPLALAIAVSTFPTAPLISLALIIGPLIELPILSIVSGILKRKNSKHNIANFVK